MHPPPEHAQGLLFPQTTAPQALHRTRWGSRMPSEMRNRGATIRKRPSPTNCTSVKTPPRTCHRTARGDPAGSPAHPTSTANLSPRARARTRPRAAGSASRCPAPRTPSRRDPRPLALRARPNKGNTASSASSGTSEPGPRSPGLRPRRRRLLGGAPAARAWRRRRRQLQQPPWGLRGARAAGARSAPAPRAQVPARAAAARAGGRRRVPAGPGPAPATPRRALLLAPAGGTAAPTRPGIPGGGGARSSALGRQRSVRLRLGRARGGGGRSAAGARTALSEAAGAAGAALRAAERWGRRRRLRLPGPSR